MMSLASSLCSPIGVAAAPSTSGTVPLPQIDTASPLSLSVPSTPPTSMPSTPCSSSIVPGEFMFSVAPLGGAALAPPSPAPTGAPPEFPAAPPEGAAELHALITRARALLRHQRGALEDTVRSRIAALLTREVSNLRSATARNALYAAAELGAAPGWRQGVEEAVWRPLLMALVGKAAADKRFIREAAALGVRNCALSAPCAATLQAVLAWSSSKSRAAALCSAQLAEECV